MNIEDYFRSLSAELNALRNRVRHFIADNHWQTDGEWKESVLRSVIRRSAPSSVSIGRGFVVAEEGCSHQIDILIYDNSHPVLYRDGDLVFIAPAACRAIIEVKSRVDAAILRESCRKLAEDADLVRRGRGGSRTLVGLFAYESTNISPDIVATALTEPVTLLRRGVVNQVALGGDRFIKWWQSTPTLPHREYRSWHLYDLQSLAVGYFIHNLLMHLSPSAECVEDPIWFPDQSKEASLIHQWPMSEVAAVS